MFGVHESSKKTQIAVYHEMEFLLSVENARTRGLWIACVCSKTNLKKKIIVQMIVQSWDPWDIDIEQSERTRKLCNNNKIEEEKSIEMSLCACFIIARKK